MLSTKLALELDFLGLGLHADSLKANFTTLDTAVGKVLTGSAVYDAPSIVDGAATSTTVTVTGAALGDFVVAVSLGLDAAGLLLSGYVSAANTVTVRLQNETGGAVDLGSTTVRALVRKF